jgi:hypothetical protein
MLHIKSRLFTILTLTIYVKQRPNNSFTDIFLDVHNIQIVPYKQIPSKEAKKYTLLPPVVPPNVFFSLLPFLMPSQILVAQDYYTAAELGDQSVQHVPSSSLSCC